MRSLITVLFMVAFVSVVNASPIGNYINDGFNDDFLDEATWTVVGTPAAHGNVWIQAGAYGNPPDEDESTGTSLLVSSGGNSGLPGGLVVSNVAVKPDAGQTAVLRADRYVLGGGTNLGSSFGFMVPGGDDRAFGADWANQTYPTYPSCSDLILLNTSFGNASGQLVLQMRKAGGALFQFNLPGEVYGGMPQYLFMDWTLNWSPDRVTVLKDGVVKFDSAVNGGASSIPSVNMNVYMASGHIYGLSGAEAITLDVVPEPATMLLLGLGGLVLRVRRRA